MWGPRPWLHARAAIAENARQHRRERGVNVNCASCGRANRDGACFCRGCGGSLVAKQAKPAEPAGARKVAHRDLELRSWQGPISILSRTDEVRQEAPRTGNALCEELERRREQYGISYVTVGDAALEPFAPVLARLTGR